MKSQLEWAPGRRPARLFATVLLSALSVLWAGCAGESAEEPSGDDLTRGLLSSAAAEAAAQRRPSVVREVPLTELGFDYGAVEAPVRVIEMSDYGCGYCRKFHLETFPSLREEFIETGMVQWKFVPYVTGSFEHSAEVLRAAECVMDQAPEAFERLSARLWTDQGEWRRSEEPEGLSRTWAGEAGADLEAFDTCMSGGARLARIDAAGRLARQLGVRGTPTFFVVGRGPIQGALPLETFQRILRSVHSEAVGSG